MFVNDLPKYQRTEKLKKRIYRRTEKTDFVLNFPNIKESISIQLILTLQITLECGLVSAKSEIFILIIFEYVYYMYRLGLHYYATN